MTARFLTSSAVYIGIIIGNNNLSRCISETPLKEIWISPLSLAIIEDTLISNLEKTPVALIRRGLDRVNELRVRMMKLATQYPYPDQTAVAIWSRIRSIDVLIPEYNDGALIYPSQTLGPDELLIFATAASVGIPLFGPSPTEVDQLTLLADFGVTFSTPKIRTSADAG